MSKSKRAREEKCRRQREKERKLEASNRRYRRRAMKARRQNRERKRAILEAGALGIRSADPHVRDDFELSAVAALALIALRDESPDERWLHRLPEGIQTKVRLKWASLAERGYAGDFEACERWLDSSRGERLECSKTEKRWDLLPESANFPSGHVLRCSNCERRSKTAEKRCDNLIGDKGSWR